MAILHVSQYQNVSTLDFTGAKNDGGGGDGYWSFERAKLQ